jgi:hypothetical protein
MRLKRWRQDGGRDVKRRHFLKVMAGLWVLPGLPALVGRERTRLRNGWVLRQDDE